MTSYFTNSLVPTSVSKFTNTTGTLKSFIYRTPKSGDVQWAKGGSIGSSVGETVTIFGGTSDSSGNVFIVGQFLGGLTFGSVVLNSVSGSFSSGFILKLDSSGTAIWGAKIGSSGGNCTFRGVSCDSTTNVYVTGSFFSTASIFSSNGVSFGSLTSTGAADVITVKYDVSGGALWRAKAATLVSLRSDVGYDLICDNSNAYITGQFTGNTNSTNITFYNSDDTTYGTTGSGNGANIFLAKYNATGFVQWLTGAGTNGTDGVYTVTVNPVNSEVYMTGFTASTSTCFYNGTAITTSGGGGFIAKTNSAGVWQWVVQVSAGACTADTSGNFYTVINSTNLYKYDTSGTYQWSVSGTSISMSSVKVVSGYIYITGSYSGTATFYNASGVAFGTTLASIGSNDVFVAKYDTAGNVIWVMRAGSTGSDTAVVVSISPNYLYIIGNYGGNTSFYYVDGTPSVPVNPLALFNPSSGGNIFTAKFLL
jgi:hypothetical protein